MSLITIELLHKVCRGAPSERLRTALHYLGPACEDGSINTPLRISAFLAQLAHESGEFRYTRELASGIAYEGRLDLGNHKKGDGKKFLGRGWMQITGRANYIMCSNALFGDETLLANPEMLEDPEYSARSAVWFWNSKDLSALADVCAFKKITRKINGASTLGPPSHHARRVEYYNRAKEFLSTHPSGGL